MGSACSQTVCSCNWVRTGAPSVTPVGTLTLIPAIPAILLGCTVSPQVTQEQQKQWVRRRHIALSPNTVGPNISEPAKPLTVMQEAKVQCTMIEHVERMRNAIKTKRVEESVPKWEREYQV